MGLCVCVCVQRVSYSGTLIYLAQGTVRVCPLRVGVQSKTEKIGEPVVHCFFCRPSSGVPHIPCNPSRVLAILLKQ